MMQCEWDQSIQDEKQIAKEERGWLASSSP